MRDTHKVAFKEQLTVDTMSDTSVSSACNGQQQSSLPTSVSTTCSGQKEVFPLSIDMTLCAHQPKSLQHQEQRSRDETVDDFPDILGLVQAKHAILANMQAQQEKIDAAELDDRSTARKSLHARLKRFEVAAEASERAHVATLERVDYLELLIKQSAGHGVHSGRTTEAGCEVDETLRQESFKSCNFVESFGLYFENCPELMHASDRHESKMYEDRVEGEQVHVKEPERLLVDNLVLMAQVDDLAARVCMIADKNADLERSFLERSEHQFVLQERLMFIEHLIGDAFSPALPLHEDACEPSIDCFYIGGSKQPSSLLERLELLEISVADTAETYSSLERACGVQVELRMQCQTEQLELRMQHEKLNQGLTGLQASVNNIDGLLGRIDSVEQALPDHVEMQCRREQAWYAESQAERLESVEDAQVAKQCNADDRHHCALHDRAENVAQVLGDSAERQAPYEESNDTELEWFSDAGTRRGSETFEHDEELDGDKINADCPEHGVFGTVFWLV